MPEYLVNRPDSIFNVYVRNPLSSDTALRTLRRKKLKEAQVY